MSTLRPQDVKRIRTQSDLIYKNTAHKVMWYRAKERYCRQYQLLVLKKETLFDKRQIDVLIETPNLQEMQESGGFIVEGNIWVWTRIRPRESDLFVWDGSTYEISADPTPIRLGATQWYKFICKRASN